MSAASDAMDQAITDPASASSDGQSATSRSMQDLITGLNYRALLDAMGKRRRGIRYTKQTNPGALEEVGGIATVDGTFNRVV